MLVEQLSTSCYPTINGAEITNVLLWSSQNRCFMLRHNSWFTTEQLQWFPIPSFSFLVNRFKHQGGASQNNQGKRKFHSLPTILSTHTWRSLLSSIYSTGRQRNEMLSMGSGTRRTKYPVGCKLREIRCFPVWLIHGEVWLRTFLMELTNTSASVDGRRHYHCSYNYIMAL